MRCKACGAIPLFNEHRCEAIYLAYIPNVTARARHVRAGSAGEACVILADVLERAGKLEHAQQIVVYAKVQNSPRWTRVVLAAAGITTYHVMHVQPMPAC